MAALWTFSQVYLVLSVVPCMSELGIILSVVFTPLGHSWYSVTNTQDLSCEPGKKWLNHTNLRDQHTNWLGTLTKSKQEERGKGTETGFWSRGKNCWRQVVAESVHGLLRDVMGWAPPRTLILLLGNRPTRECSCLDICHQISKSKCPVDSTPLFHKVYFKDNSQVKPAQRSG